MSDPDPTLSRRPFTPAATAPLAAFIARCSRGRLQADWAATVLTTIVAGPEAICELWRGDERVGLAVSIDNSAGPDAVAELSLFTPEADAAVLRALLAWGEERARAVARRRVDVPIWPGTAVPEALLVARRYRHGHTMYDMHRPADAGAPPLPRTPLPARWRWATANDELVEGYHQTASASFAGVPSAFVPPLEIYHEAVRRFEPTPALLLSTDPEVPVAGFLRIERRDDGDGWIAALGRHPRFRGLGLGEHLVGRGIDWLTELGSRAMGLEVAATNAAGLTLYERYGFRIVSEMAVWRRPLDG